MSNDFNPDEHPRTPDGKFRETSNGTRPGSLPPQDEPPITPVYETMEVTGFPAGVGSYFSPTIYHVDERDQATIDDFLKRGVRFTTKPDPLCEPLAKAFANKDWNVETSMIYDGSDDASEYYDSVPRRVTVELTPKNKPAEGVNDLTNVDLTMDGEEGEGVYENVFLKNDLLGLR
ncbi:hypothetical protein [Bifidobacterium callitrichidarum]|uniref:hypothetical protein n=1 Tax=Bifidobacterium callitrichidarum TaxID=2052941 RepID=UPI0011B1F28F|nr:hypothetical protein [Bifidobacterium callitrichidarum]